MDTEEKRSHYTRFTQLKANLKLHFLRKLRRPFGTLVELVLPLSFTLMALFMPQERQPSLRDNSLAFTQFPVFLAFFMTLLLPFSLRAIVEEKEADLKGLMTIMGLKKSVYWCGWILTYAVFAFFIAIVGAAPIVSKVYIFRIYATFFLLMFVYMLSIITMSCLISTLQTKSTSAVIWGLTITCATAIITKLVETEFNTWAWCFVFFSPASFACATRMLADRSRMANTVLAQLELTDAHSVSVGYYILAMVAQTLLYFLLALWFDGIIPSEFGIHRDPWYCFKPQRKKPSAEEKKLIFFEDYDENIEKISPEKRRKVTISIQNVSKSFQKRFKEKTTPIRDISLHICKGEIIAIGGRNGCGKTTLFRVLTGVNRPDVGKARIMGCDTSNPIQMSTVRPFMGVCRQDDVAFKHLTIYEHLEYFARIKGIAASKIHKRILRYAKALNVEAYIDEQFGHLSKGLRRQCCFLNAFIGDPKILLLDDPSSGLDPISRRRMWSMLKRNQADRTVIISSHILNDADALADRTVIMAQGKIKCAGSTDFLLSKYSRGYHLRFTLRLASRELITKLEHIVQSVIPDSEVGKSHGAELSFVLPLYTKKSFDVLFDKVDKEVRGNKDIIDFGISTPTLEHIFYGFHRSLYKRNAALGGSEFAGAHDFESSEHGESRGFRKSRYHGVEIQNKSRHHLYQEFKALAYIRFAKKANDICSFTPLMLLPMMLLLYCVLFISNSLSGETGDDDDGWDITTTTASATMVGVCFNIIPAGLMIEYINDREVGARKLLYIVGSVPRVYIASFVPFYGTIMCIIILYYGILLAVAGNNTIPFQISLLFCYTIPSFLFVGTLSHLFPRALTLTAYCCVLSFGLIPYAIGASIVDEGPQIVLAFLFPLYIPYLMAQLSYDQDLKVDNDGVDIARPIVFLLYVACAFHLLWIFPLRFADHYVNGKYLSAWKDSDGGKDASEPSKVVRKSRQFRKPVPPVAPPVSPGRPAGSPDFPPKVEEIASPSPRHEVEDFEPFPEEDKESKHKVKKQKKEKKPKKEKKGKKDKKHKKDKKKDKKPGHFEVLPQSLQLRGKPHKDVETQNTMGGAIPENYLPAIEGSQGGMFDQFVSDPDAVLEAINVHKKYPGTLCGPGKATAVKDFCISINEGDLVCIVGRNGSGKTTMTKLLIGEEMPTKGMILYRKKPLWKSDIFDNLGSSLEFGLWKYVDVEQHLNLYAALKGVESSAIREYVDHFLFSMALEKDRKRCLVRCGGGTKKKVLDAIALIGNPDIIILDEPTTGLDLFSKRLMWDFLLEYCGGKKTVLLTTPWLEEAEALGTKIGILERGNLSSFGTYEELKAAGEKHYTLKIRLKIPDNVQEQKEQLGEIIQVSPGARFQERFLSRFVFDIPNPTGDVTVKSIFNFLDSRRDKLGVIQFTISNNTLGKYIF